MIHCKSTHNHYYHGVLILEHNKDLHNFCTIKMCRIITIVFYGYQILLAVQFSTIAIPFSPNIMLNRADVYYMHADKFYQ